MAAPPLPFADACERNKDPILEVLRGAFHGVGEVLEVGSGTGQHAVWFARHLPGVTWQPSELAAGLEPLSRRLQAEAPANVRAPIALDVIRRPWAERKFQGLFSANTLHIMSAVHVEHFFLGAGEVLVPGGVLCVYGPFRYGGQFTTPSNAQFDQWLRSGDPLSGVRDFEVVDALSRAQGFALVADHAMPANNQMLVWQRAVAG
jgi:SAM-dependent methyltransferase